MVTLETTVPCIVVTPQNSSLAVGVGTWHFDQLTSVRGSTNVAVSTSSVRDGGVVVVDQTGYVEIYGGPDFGVAAIQGFSVALLTIGILLFARWVVRRWGSATSGGNVE